MPLILPLSLLSSNKFPLILTFPRPAGKVLGFSHCLKRVKISFRNFVQSQSSSRSEECWKSHQSLTFSWKSANYHLALWNKLLLYELLMQLNKVYFMLSIYSIKRDRFINANCEEWLFV